jgi:hypothetical protein
MPKIVEPEMFFDASSLNGKIVSFPDAADGPASVALCGKDKYALCILGTPLLVSVVDMLYLRAEAGLPRT